MDHPLYGQAEAFRQALHLKSQGYPVNEVCGLDRVLFISATLSLRHLKTPTILKRPIGSGLGFDTLLAESAMAKLILNANPAQVDWFNDDNYLFLNSRWPQNDFLLLQESPIILKHQTELTTGLIFLASSGTGRDSKQPVHYLKVIAKEKIS